MQTYRLINNKTKEETICSLVTIDGFEYYVSTEKEQVVLGKQYYESDNNIPIYSFTTETLPKEYYLNHAIATNNPNIDIPKVIDETEESFNIVDDIKVRYSGEEADLWCSYKIGFGDGYNKAKETYQYTEEDMIYFITFYNGYKELLRTEGWESIEVSEEKILEKWKEQQIKTIYYE